MGDVVVPEQGNVLPDQAEHRVIHCLGRKGGQCVTRDVTPDQERRTVLDLAGQHHRQDTDARPFGEQGHVRLVLHLVPGGGQRRLVM